MANVITYGVAPRWGLADNVNPDVASLLINDVSTTPNISEYLAKGNNGETRGYLVYDQYIDWTLQGVLTGSGAGLPRFGSQFDAGILASQTDLFNGGPGNTVYGTFSVAKTVATTQTSGDAYQITINGSIYPFDIANNGETACSVPPGSATNPSNGI